MNAHFGSYALPATLTPTQKRERAQQVKTLEKALELGMRGSARSVTLSSFLKEAKRRKRV